VVAGIKEHLDTATLPTETEFEPAMAAFFATALPDQVNRRVGTLGIRVRDSGNVPLDETRA